MPRIEHLRYHRRDDAGDGPGDHVIHHNRALFAVKQKGGRIWRTWNGHLWLPEASEDLVQAFDALQAAGERRRC